jgi:hypothetical protein
MLSLSGSGYRAALFHLGALTRINELGLLARVDMVGAVAGGSILAALLAARVPWPLNGPFGDWPEAVAEPMRRIARRNARTRAFGRGPTSSGTGGASEERYARQLLETLGGEAPQRPRFIFGGAGLVLGEMGVDADAAGPGGVHWEIGRAASPPGYGEALVAEAIAAVGADLDALGEAEQAVLENHGYLLADAAIRRVGAGVSEIELPPLPPHPGWMDDERVRAALTGSSRRTRLGRLRPRRA